MSISNDQYWFVVSWWDPEWSWPHLAVFEVLELSNQEADTEDNEMWEVGGNFKVFSWSVSNGAGGEIPGGEIYTSRRQLSGLI